MDRIDAMKMLIAAVDGGSLSAASRKLGTPLATVSRKVSDLEAQLRAQIVVRTSRKLILTEAGEVYVAACRRVLEEIDDAERTLSGEYRIPRGNLTITASVMFGQLYVQPVVLDFLKAYPNIDVRMILSDQVVSIIDDHIDAAVRVGSLSDSNMMAARLGEIRWVVCASPEYLKARGIPRVPSDLASHDCIMFEGVHSNSVWSNEVWNFGQGRTATALHITPRLRVNTVESAIAAAVAGNGIVRLLCYQTLEAETSGALTAVMTDLEPEAIPVHLVHIGQAIIPLKLRAFLDFATPRLRAALQRACP